MKIFINHANESWVVDRFREEWKIFNQNITTENINDADIVWIIAPWTWKTLPKKILKEKIVVCTIHHLDFEKFNSKEEKNFFNRDKYINFYHSISQKTTTQLKRLTDKEIQTHPFWVNQNIFFEMPNKDRLRNKYNINENAYLIGSFQRDTEGKDLISPKLSKGPDRLVEIFHTIYQKNKNTIILLTGKRRNYIINKLEDLNIPFLYFEMPNFTVLNELYNCLDLYIVASRVEGGPQALYECAITKTPIISTDVGMASNVLSQKSIFNMSNYLIAEPDTEFAYEKVKNYLIPEGFTFFKDFFNKIVGVKFEN